MVDRNLSLILSVRGGQKSKVRVYVVAWSRVDIMRNQSILLEKFNLFSQSKFSKIRVSLIIFGIKYFYTDDGYFLARILL